MRLYYYRDPNGNFGDDLNIWLWSRLLPEVVDVDNPCNLGGDASSDETLFIGIGSILDDRIPEKPQKVVFGTGTHGSPPAIGPRWKVMCVRGPRTAEALNVSRSLALTDGAVLVRTLLEVKRKKSNLISYMPHHVSTKMVNWKKIADRAGFTYIDPAFSVERILDMIGESELIITEAMHGAIVADALRVPWIPVQIHGHINDFKWTDWCESVGLSYSPHRPSHYLGKPNGVWGSLKESVKQVLVVKFLKSLENADAILSKSQRIDALTEDMLRKIEEIRDFR